MPITVPSKTEESLGIEKSDNVPEGVVLDPRHWTTAAQLELMKTKLIELCASFNAIEGSVASIPGAILYDMPIATASVGAPVRYRTNADSGTPAGTAATSLVTCESYPNRQALRLSATGLTGGLVWPVLHGLTLPEEYVLEVEIASLAVTNKGVIFSMCDFYADGGVDSVRGLSHEHYRALGQVDTRTVARLTGPYGAVNNIVTTTGWPVTPAFNRRLHVARYHVRRRLTPNIGSPAQWTLRAVHDGDGQSDMPFALSGVANAQADFNSQVFDEIGIGVYGASGAMHIDVAGLRIRKP